MWAWTVVFIPTCTGEQLWPDHGMVLPELWQWQTGMASAALSVFWVCWGRWGHCALSCWEGDGDTVPWAAGSSSGSKECSLQWAHRVSLQWSTGHLRLPWADLSQSTSFNSQGWLKPGLFALSVAQLGLLRIEMFQPYRELGASHGEAWISHSSQEIQTDDSTVPFGKSSGSVRTLLREELHIPVPQALESVTPLPSSLVPWWQQQDQLCWTAVTHSWKHRGVGAKCYIKGAPPLLSTQVSPLNPFLLYLKEF